MTINANTEISDNAINRAAMIRLYERRVNGKVSLVLDGHEVRLDKLIKEAELSPRGMDRFREAVDQELQRTYKEAFSLSRRSLLDLVMDQASFAYQNIENVMGKIWRTERPPKRIAEDLVLKQPLHENMTLEAGWAGVSKQEKIRLEALIRKGISEGKTVDQIALDVRRGNIHSISRMQSKALVVTAITSVVAQADHAVYRANERALVGWQYVATLDARTTPLCAHRDGHVYPISDTAHLPPAHFHCRSVTLPVFKSWADIAKLEGVAQVRRDNIKNLTKEQIAYYDGQTPLKESYNAWLLRQPTEIQIRHLGDYQRAEMFRSGQLTVDQFTNPEGNSIGIRELRQLTDGGYTLPGDTKKFAIAKEKLDAMQLGASRPEDFYGDNQLRKTLMDYYVLQSKELDGTLSLTNYRGTLLGNKKATKQRVLAAPPRDDQTRFNPVTGRYEDVRLYQPNASVYSNALRLVDESEKLLDADKKFIRGVVEELGDQMSMNERAVIADNLRIVFGRYRDNKEVWTNFKAVVQGQIKFDVMNISDAIETQLRKDTDVLKRLKDENYLDPVLGPTQLDQLHDEFLDNIRRKNHWEDTVAPKLARELEPVFKTEISPIILARVNRRDLHQFYLRFAHRLSMADGPDRDQFAVALGRDLYNLANMNGNRRQWYEQGMRILNSERAHKFFEIETFGVQKRRMKSRLSGSYFGPYYDTVSYNIRVTDPRITEYSQLTRKVELGLRVSVTRPENRLVFREGYKTYFIDRGFLGYEDTRIPITSTSSFSDFPEEFVDKDMVNALNWAAKSEYKIDEDFYDFVQKLLYFQDDRGKAKYYDGLNEYRHYITSRGDAYERFKAMEWLRSSGRSFSNHPFIDHRARIYERGLIGPQSGETFRPFLNTKEAKNFSPEEFLDLQDQIGAFLGGLSDKLEGQHNSLTITGRQKIALKWRDELVKVGNHMRRAKPNDIRAILESDLVQSVEGEEQGKFFRFAIEMAKIDEYLRTKAANPFEGKALYHISTKPLTNLNFKPRVPDNFLVRGGYEDGVTERISFAENIDDALKAMSMDLKGKRLYVYKAPADTEYETPSVKQVPDVKITSERWVRTPVKVEYVGDIQVGEAIEEPFTYKYGDNTAEMYGWNWKPLTSRDPYSRENLKHLNDYKIALALEQDASSSGAQIIALTTKNKQLAELSNVVPTTQKRRLYDEIAASTYNDPRFRKINEKLGLTEKDLRKAAKAQNMVTFYGAGERTGILNVEGKLGKVLGKDKGTLVVKASDRDTVLNEISARAARVEKYDPEGAELLKQLRQDVRDVFNKGIDPGDEIMEQLWFLDPKTKDLVEKMTGQYERVVTPDDFKQIAGIMSDHLREQVPILKDFTRFFGRLAEDYLANAKPSKAAWDWKEIASIKLLGSAKKGWTLPPRTAEFFGLRANEPVSEKILKRLSIYNPQSTLHDLIYGTDMPKDRNVGGTIFKIETPGIHIFKVEFFNKKLAELKLFYDNKKLPKSWTNVPWVNFDGKVIEQNFTQTFEERLVYKDANGNWQNNIVQVPQKTEINWWDQLMNESGKINDIANATQARTAFAVNGNHSNDAVIVKRFHLWGRENNIATSTIHDAFFANAADMLAGRMALRRVYARTLDQNVVKATLDEMRARGLPKEVYEAYLNEAIDIGLIPVVGRSKVGGKLVTDKDILKKEDILREVPSDFKDDYGWYGVG